MTVLHATRPQNLIMHALFISVYLSILIVCIAMASQMLQKKHVCSYVANINQCVTA